MSWTDSFPVLTDDMIQAWEGNATEDERKQQDGWFAVERIINRSRARHLVVFAIYDARRQPARPVLSTVERLGTAETDNGELGKDLPVAEDYVRPLLESVVLMRKRRPDIGFRIYLSADLGFLIGEFVEAGCEIHLMKASCFADNPGSMWKFLALGERGRLLTFCHLDGVSNVESDVQRTELMAKIGLSLWRVPDLHETTVDGMMAYRPISARQFGANRSFPIKRLMKALIWSTERDLINITCRPPGCGQQFISGTHWSCGGFDDWFLLAAVYPRVARNGILSFVPASASSRLLPLDIEYCTWANPRAEINYFGSDSSCCVPHPAGV